MKSEEKNMSQNQSTIGLDDIARPKDSIFPEGNYDHGLQQLVDAEGNSQVTRVKNGIVAVSDTQFDGEKS